MKIEKIQMCMRCKKEVAVRTFKRKKLKALELCKKCFAAFQTKKRQYKTMTNRYNKKIAQQKEYDRIRREEREHQLKIMQNKKLS